MKYFWLFVPALLLAAAAYCADLPAIPDAPIGAKKELLLADDFERAELGKDWGPVVPTYTLENGTLKGTQSRVNIPTVGCVSASSPLSVIGTDTPTQDSIIELRFRFAGATALLVGFIDRKYTGSHNGRICRVVITPRTVTLRDERDGWLRNDIYQMSPTKLEERSKLLVGRNATFPVQFDAEKWHDLTLETIGDAMRATIDGKPVAYLKASGIAHATKSKIELGCAGKDGYFDDIKIWNAEAIAP